MTPRKRVELALRFGEVDRVPFTMYENKIYSCTAERELRNEGMCIVNRHHHVFKVHRPNVKVRHEGYYENGKKMERTYFSTPVGEVTTLNEPGGYTTWTHERMFKSPEDYKVIRFYIEDEQYEPCYEEFARAEKDLGEDVILRSGLGAEPLQSLITERVLMGMDQFCIEWMDNRDEVLKLFDAIVKKKREIYPLVAKSPALIVNYGGNVTPAITGPDMFEKYYLPHYNEAAEVLHRHGKLIGSHLDDKCRLLAPLIAQTDLDYIEAFTPAPDTDMTLEEARKAWPKKVLWTNFPSSQHLKSDEEVEAITRDLVRQAGMAGLIMAITENIPPYRWQDSCRAIMRGLIRSDGTRG